MKEALVAVIVAFAAWLNTAPLIWWARLICVLALAAIAIAAMTLIPGCMVTTDLDGKTYSTRVDILTPIMPTNADPAVTTTIRTAPARSPRTAAPTSQPAS